MNASLKLRSLSGWSILLLGVLLFVTSFAPAVLRDGRPPTAGLLGLFGLLAIGIGVALSAARDATLSEAAARRFCVALMSLVFAAAGGFLDVLVQRTSFFDGLGSLHAVLVVLFAVLFGIAVFTCIAIARQSAAAFLAPSESFLSLGGSIDPLSFLVVQPMFLIFAAVVAGAIAAQAGGTRDGLLLSIALALAALPFIVTAQLALCAKRWRDTSTRWPSYGVLAWAAFLALGAFHEIFEWLVSVPGALISSSPMPAFPHMSLLRVLFATVSLAACVCFYFLSRRRTRHGFFLRAFGNAALGIGSLFFASVGLALSRAQSLSPVRTTIIVLVAAGLITVSFFLVFRRDDKIAVS